MQSRQDRQNLPCAVILTAIAVEFKAVRAHLSNCQEEVHPEGTVYERGTFSSNGHSWQVKIVQIGAGNVEAAVETKRAIDYFKPSVVLFVGVAGGLKDVALGDVVAATKVYGYESGKVIEENFLPRPNVSQVSYALEQRAKAEARKDDWLQRIKPVPTTKPRALVEAIAAGDKVVSATNSDFYRQLRSNYSDAVAVEMESHGFLKAVRANREIDALIIRGISDLVDGKSHADAAGSQEIAARHASAFAFEILAKLNVNPGIIETTNNLPQTTDALIQQVEQYLSDPNGYIPLNKLLLQEAKTLTEVMQGELEACPWEISPQNQLQCQQCIEYLEAKSERFVLIIATIVHDDQKAQFINPIAKAFKTLAKEPFPMNTYNITEESRIIRLYPLALAIYAVFIVGVQEQREELLRTVLKIRLNWQARSIPDLPLVYVLSYLDVYSRSIFNNVLGGTPYYAPVAERIKRILIPLLEEILINANTAFYQGEFVLGLANIEAPYYLSNEKSLSLRGLYLYFPEALPILTAYLKNSSQWLFSLYPSMEELLGIFDETASKLDREGFSPMDGFSRGALAALKEKEWY